MNKNEQFVNKLIELTKTNKMTWLYLDENDELFSTLNLSPFERISSTFDYDEFNSDSSFYAKINSNFIVLYELRTASENLLSSLRLKTVPSTFKDIQNIELTENKELLLRLLNVVKSQFPNSEDIINDILNL